MNERVRLQLVLAKRDLALSDDTHDNRARSGEPTPLGAIAPRT